VKSREAAFNLDVKSNPFATRRVRPGVIPWIGENKHSLDSIVSRWESQRSRIGAIIGPHGTGKSTLLIHLVPRCFSWTIRGGTMALAGDCQGSVAWVQLRRGQNVNFGRLPPILWKAGVRDWILDGFEQLWLHQKVYVLLQQWIRGGKLLVTAHRWQLGIPVIYRTESSPELTRDLVSSLLQDSRSAQKAESHSPWEVELEAFVLASWQRHGGNIREVFMDLYDHVGESSRLVGQERELDKTGV
jgi:hypothetical protein